MARHFLGLAFAIGAGTAVAAGITSAHYAEPVMRYGHFAAGRPHEYAQLVAGTEDGRRLTLTLPDDEVFEDVRPRPVRLTPEGAAEVLTIVSHRDSGARLALIGLREGALAITAQSRPIGTPMRWLNPAGVADLDGDGRAEIAAVTTPHIGGVLRLFRRAGGALVEAAALARFSNHVYGSSVLGLSTVMPVDGQMRLLVPSADRAAVRLVAWRDGALVEVGRCVLRAPVTGAMTVRSPAEVAVDTERGREVFAPAACRSP